jgi:hypothetical protein
VQQADGGAGPFTVGIGTPGSATPDGLMKNCNSTCLNGQPLQRDLQARAAARPLRLENDANCLALSEATDGAGAGADVVFAAIIGTGTGAGIAVHGRVLRGPNGLAGEWGHNPLPWAVPADPLPACYCGQQRLHRDPGQRPRPGARPRAQSPARRWTAKPSWRRPRPPATPPRGHAGPPRVAAGARAGVGDQPAGPRRDRARAAACRA